jgi:hypothetical protein
MEVLTETEKARRREYIRAAAAVGQTLEQFQAAHEQRVQRWCDLFHAEMEKARTDDPVEVLPALMAKIEESAIAAARAAAEKVARSEVEKMLRRAFA